MILTGLILLVMVAVAAAVWTELQLGQREKQAEQSMNGASFQRYNSDQGVASYRVWARGLPAVDSNQGLACLSCHEKVPRSLPIGPGEIWRCRCGQASLRGEGYREEKS